MRSTPSLGRSTLSSHREYPPDTPDRPAPLKIRSRGADSEPVKTVFRSFSTPLHAQTAPRFGCLVDPTVNNPAQSARNASTGDARPVSSIYSNDEGVGSFVSSNGMSEVSDSANDAFPYQDLVRAQPRYELEPHELAESASNSPMVQTEYPSSEFGGPAESNTGSVFEDKVPENSDELMESLETDLQNMLNTESSQPIKDRDSALTTPDNQQQQRRPNYTLTGSSTESRLRTFASNPRATPAERRAAAQARHAARLPNFAAMTGFHRPVPLRSYESEAFLFPTARAQGALAHTRASSLTASTSHACRPLDIVGVDEFSHRVGPSNLRSATSPNGHSRNSSRATRPESIDEVDLSLFPDVPISNAPLDPDSLGNAYKSVTEAYMRQSLQRYKVPRTNCA
jgi:hypothetical protein